MYVHHLHHHHDGVFHQGYLLDDDDEILEAAHDGPVTALLFVIDEDGQRQLISTGSDLRILQAPIEEGRPMPREAKETHAQLRFACFFLKDFVIELYCKKAQNSAPS